MVRRSSTLCGYHSLEGSLRCHRLSSKMFDSSLLGSLKYHICLGKMLCRPGLLPHTRRPFAVTAVPCGNAFVLVHESIQHKSVVTAKVECMLVRVMMISVSPKGSRRWMIDVAKQEFQVSVHAVLS